MSQRAYAGDNVSNLPTVKYHRRVQARDKTGFYFPTDTALEFDRFDIMKLDLKKGKKKKKRNFLVFNL